MRNSKFDWEILRLWVWGSTPVSPSREYATGRVFRYTVTTVGKLKLRLWRSRCIVSSDGRSEKNRFLEQLRFSLKRRLGGLWRQLGFAAGPWRRRRGQRGRFVVLLKRTLVLLGKTFRGRSHVRAVGFLSTAGVGDGLLDRGRSSGGNAGGGDRCASAVGPHWQIHDQIWGAAVAMRLMMVMSSGRQWLRPVDGSLRVGPFPPQSDLVIERIVTHAQALGVGLAHAIAGKGVTVRGLGPVVVLADGRHRRRDPAGAAPPPSVSGRPARSGRRGRDGCGWWQPFAVLWQLFVHHRILAWVQAVRAAHLQNDHKLTKPGLVAQPRWWIPCPGLV